MKKVAPHTFGDEVLNKSIDPFGVYPPKVDKNLFSKGSFQRKRGGLDISLFVFFSKNL